ncbi:peptidase S8 [Kitasatospora herbaricolor]|uniref:S53 family peptidase n=1 Tax=Kitasatospora herbaricolor TaxID=68217 RepID=UPI0036DA9B89
MRSIGLPLSTRRPATALATTVLAFSTLIGASPAEAQGVGGSGASWIRACSTLAAGDTVRCHGLQVTNSVQRIGQYGVSLNGAPAGYGPADLLDAYNLPANGGAGQTIAVIDAYDHPNAEADLAVYRAQFGLPACTTANGCFKKVDQNGGTRYPRKDAGWAGEISLDLAMVSAIAPNAKIILVEAKKATLADLGTGVNTAVRLGAKFISNSYGANEASSDPAYDASYFDHPGVAITASSGDSGLTVQYPAASRKVIAVGGTALWRDSSTRGWSESVYANGPGAAGSGCSAHDAKPVWQKDTGCANRTVADVSAVADPATGVAVYQTYGAKGGWVVYGGTSVGAPIIAAVYANAGVPTVSYPAANPYTHSSELFDVSSGATGSCSPAYLCTGTVGYDGPTGLGTPNGIAAFAG